MDSLANDYAAGLLNSHEPPCLSLYQPTHRHHPDNAQDPIRFRNLVRSLDESLRRKLTSREVQPLLDAFMGLADDREFWNYTLDGLAVLAAPDFFRVYRLQRPVVELAVVADSFHIKPLLRILQSADRYQLLGLSRQEIKLFEGNRDALDEIAPVEGGAADDRRRSRRGADRAASNGSILRDGSARACDASRSRLKKGRVGYRHGAVFPCRRSSDPRASLASVEPTADFGGLA